jgi:hypothetical protein
MKQGKQENTISLTRLSGKTIQRLFFEGNETGKLKSVVENRVERSLRKLGSVFSSQPKTMHVE